MEIGIDLGLGAATLTRLALEKVSTGKGLSPQALADSLEVSQGMMTPVRPWVTAHGYAEVKWTPRGSVLVATAKGIAETKKIFSLFNRVIEENHTHINQIYAGRDVYFTNIVNISDSNLDNFFTELESNITESSMDEQDKTDVLNKITQLVSALSGVGMLSISLKTLFGDP